MRIRINDLIATDGSINRFDERTAQFQPYFITDSTGLANANWAYYLMEDERGYLWVATCLGGIFIVDKQRLIHSLDNHYLADDHITTDKGLSSAFVNQIVPDHRGYVWALLYNKGINRIQMATRKVFQADLQVYTRNRKPNYLFSDAKGTIWIGLRGGLLSINPSTLRVTPLYLANHSNAEILSMVEVEADIWISTTDGIWIVNKETLADRWISLSEKRFTSLFYDSDAKMVYMGGLDGIVKATSVNRDFFEDSRPLMATALYVNNRPYELNGSSIRYVKKIRLPYHENNISVDVSDLPYAQTEKSQFLYQLEGVDRGWNLLYTGTNRISYSHLNPGSYRLLVAKPDSKGLPSSNRLVIPIQITPPWYGTWVAMGIYLILIMGLALWAFHFFRIRSRLKMEHVEKERIMEQSRQKIDFLANLSHEMKTPLSLIIAPLGKLMAEIKDPSEKRQLEQIQRHAMKLNAQIHQLLDINRLDSQNKALLILSRVELVSLTQKICQLFEEPARERNISLQITSTEDKLYMDIDVIKWESVLTNLLSNALKYTPDGGHIEVTLRLDQLAYQVVLTVFDDGAGIAGKDLPYIFQRFFQAFRSEGTKREGSGVGLYLVKTYVEMHGGTVNAVSDEGSGTTITVIIPFKPASIATPDDQALIAEKNAVNSQKPLVLVVDDDPEMVSCIATLLQPDYRCEVASDGKEGLELCLSCTPDLIISDVKMPVMGGIEMCRLIKKEIPTSTIPVIFLTAMDDSQTELESISINVDAFISKPFQPEILKSRVHQLIQKNKVYETKIRMEELTRPQAD